MVRQLRASLLSGSVVLLFVPLVLVSPVSADDLELGSTATLEQIEKGWEQVEQAKEQYSIEVQAAAEPAMPLEYRFWPSPRSRKPGEARIHFQRALGNLRDAGDKGVQFQRLLDESNDFTDPSVRKSVAKQIEELSHVFRELECFAARETQCWDSQLHELTVVEFYDYPLPEVRGSRELARCLQVKARYQVHEGDFHGGCETLQIGFRLAHFVGQGETVLQSLVGIAINGIMLAEVEHAIHQAGCPNLYWALATLPRPLVQVRRTLELELESMLYVFPGFLEAENTQNNDPAYWAEQLGSWIKQMKAVHGEGDRPYRLEQGAASLIAVASIPSSRQSLISRGMTEQEVLALAPIRAVFLAGALDIREQSQQLTKVMLLPADMGRAQSAQISRRFEEWLRANMMRSIGAISLGVMLPSVQAARSAENRSNSNVNRLMNIEALRMHAATHGRFPSQLIDVDGAPAYVTDGRGETIQYQVGDDGQQATLSNNAVPNHYPPELKSTRLVLTPSNTSEN